jgi:ribose/xylose/arabinose/galactoside ABC-type transport system permease subunit
MTAIAQPKRQSASRSSRLSNLLSQELVLILAIIALAVVTQISNPRYLSGNNPRDVLNNASYIAIAAIGMSMVIISGNIDISVGSLIGVLMTLSGTIAKASEGSSIPVEIWILIAYIAPPLVGALIGLFIGTLVAYLRIPAIVVTLGMMSILKGGLIIVTGGAWIYNLPPQFNIAQQRILEIPVPVWVMVIGTIAAFLALRYTSFGRAIYAVGGNREAARLSGINDRRVILLVFVMNGFIVGIMSALFATQFNAIQSTVPPGIELQIITASVVGGVSILGGIGTVFGSTLAAIFVQMIQSSMQFLRISDYWIQAVQGLLILMTVLADLYRRRRTVRRR